MFRCRTVKHGYVPRRNGTASVSTCPSQSIRRAMPRTRVFHPAQLRKQAEQRLRRAKVLELQQSRLPPVNRIKEEEDQKTTGKSDGGEDGNKKKAESINPVSRQADVLKFSHNPSNSSSKILDALSKEPTYCLTGSKLFWQINERGTNDGRWRSQISHGGGRYVG